MKDIFRYFIRKNYLNFGGEINNEDIDEIGVEFHRYLNVKLSNE